jgi:hypothetical protein
LKLKSQNLKTVPQPVCVWNGEEIQPVIWGRINRTFLRFDCFTEYYLVRYDAVLSDEGFPMFLIILVPATEHGYFVASWWRTPLRNPAIVTRFYFQQIYGIHAPVGKIKGCSLSGGIPPP